MTADLLDHPSGAHAAARRRLIEAARCGQTTLVLGAGVSRPYGVPGWEELGRRVWDLAFPGQPSPWAAQPEQSPRLLPQFLPIVFEMAEAALGPERFSRMLREGLYGEARAPEAGDFARADSSLAVVAQVLVREAERRRRRIARVVTFNADDLVERATASVAGGPAPVRRIAQAGQSPLTHCAGGEIPVYHLHGYLPRDPGPASYEHMLVFTDRQYWSSTMNAMSLANLTMGAALHDSHCIFVGLSMTDINVLRWLALRHVAVESDEARRPRAGDADEDDGMAEAIHRGLTQHFWVRPRADDPTGFMTRFLAVRGVIGVDIGPWEGPSFAKLMDECFGDGDHGNLLRRVRERTAG
ncbi:MAG TPA: SIR2 family protein [Pelomicrobium sp.]|nr:SIR2 family protein [Pelomicrobium sp.]